MFAATATLQRRADRPGDPRPHHDRPRPGVPEPGRLAAGRRATPPGSSPRTSATDCCSPSLTSRFLLAEGVTDMPDRRPHRLPAAQHAARRSTGCAACRTTLISQSRAGVGLAGHAGTPGSRRTTPPPQQLRAFELDAADALAERATPVAVGVLVRLGARRPARPDRRRRLDRRLDPGRPLAHRPAAPAARRGAGDGRRAAAHRGPPAAARRGGRRRRRGAAAGVRHATRSARSGSAFNEVQRTAVQSAVEEADAAPRPQRGLPQHRPAQPDAAAPAARPAGPDGAARPPSRTSWRTSSGSTTSPPGCAGTPRTWSSWPARRPAGAGATRSR